MNCFVDDTLTVYKTTNDEKYAFYVSEIENHPTNESFIIRYREQLMKMIFDPGFLIDEKGRSLQLEYFRMLYNGYKNFPEKYMKIQKVSLNKEVMASFYRLVSQSKADVVMDFLGNTNFETDLDDLFARVNKSEKLTKEHYHDLKEIVSFVCRTINVEVEHFLKNYDDVTNMRN